MSGSDRRQEPRRLMQSVPARGRRRVLEGAIVAGVLSGAPSICHAALTESPSAAIRYAVDVTRTVGTMIPPRRPGLIRGSVVHGVISLGAAEILARTLPGRHSVLWGAVGGLLIGVVNLGVIAPRAFAPLTSYALGPQIADNVAFGAVFAAIADRDASFGAGTVR